MPMPLVPSYNTKRVFGTWVRQAGTEMRPGSYRVTVPVRITNATDDVIIPEGVYATGILNTTVGLPSLDIQAPCTDDPDNWPNGWQLLVEITFPDAPKETYRLDVPIAGEPINLRTIILSQNVADPEAYLIRGVAGGVAALDADGDVIDAGGAKVAGGGGGGVESWAEIESLPDYPDLVKGGDVRLITTAERSKLAGVADGATANATNAQLRDRGTHTGTQAASTITDLVETVQDILGAAFSGGNVTASYNDAAGTISLTAPAGSTFDPEATRDAIGAALIGTNGISVVINDAGDTITISTNAATAATASTLAMRGTDGTLTVAAPTAGGHAATKTYVDGVAANTFANAVAGATYTVVKPIGGVWPGGTASTWTRPTSRADLTFNLVGQEPAPPIVTSGTGGILAGSDFFERLA